MPIAEHGLLEREREVETLHDRLEQAASGRGGVVVLEGAAGVGKSALLRELAEIARGQGVRVLTAIGGELERDYPFGMVRQLLEAELVGTTPERRERLLSGAAALAAPVVGAAPQDGQQPGADSPFATLHGLYWLVAALSDEQPLLLILDDAHWADAASLRFVDFLARRVAELPVLIAVGVRPAEPGAEAALLDAIAESDDAIAVRPGPLSAAAVDTLVARGLGERANEGVAGAAFAATGGNPLLLRELVNALGADDGELSAAAVEAVVPSSVTRSVQRRVERLPAQARTVAAALATVGDRDPGEVLALATGLDPTALAEGLQALRAADLVVPDAHRFVHPLVRQAIADGVPVGERHRLHATVARALHARRGASEDVIVHLLAAPPLGEPWAREVLQAGARRALAEGAPESAVRRIERAIEESDGAAPPALLLELGAAKLSAGDGGGIVQLAIAADADDPVVAAQAGRALVSAESLSGTFDGEAAVRRLEESLDRLGADAPVELVDALTGGLISTATIDRSLAGRVRELLHVRDPRELPSLAALRAYAGACGDLPADEVVALAQTALGPTPFAALSQVETGHSWLAVGALHLVDGLDLAEAAMAQAEATARRAGSRLGRAFVLTVRAHLVQLGFVAGGEAAARDAVELWRDAGFAILADTVTSQIVSALTLRGRLDEADRLLASRPDPTALMVRGQGQLARVQLRLAQRRTAEAVRELREVQEIADDFGWRRFQWGFTGALLATALAADGQRDEARAVAEEEVEVARRGCRPSQLVAALTALAATQEGDEQLAALEAAVAVGAEARAPLPRALARVELGAALRRRGLRQDARRWLREGHEIAGRAELTALAERAMEELVIAGGRPRSRFSSGVESLTPSERRVAEHAAAGLSNREIAETLFVTRKTVELHLGRAYGKLGIRSRTQLPAALGQGDGDADA